MLVEVLLARYDTKGENTVENTVEKKKKKYTGQSTEGHSDVAKWLNDHGLMSNFMKMARSFAKKHSKDKSDAAYGGGRTMSATDAKAAAAAAKKSKGKNKRAGGMISTKKTYAHGGGVRRPKR
jgi:hypothetical protein|tara:strand:- start:150 stop:518 length:369 start_codon:yes stop_codon:yes gene_type:complete